MGEANRWLAMFGLKAKKKTAEVEQCSNCGDLIKTVCQGSGQVMKPNDHCSRWRK